MRLVDGQPGGGRSMMLGRWRLLGPFGSLFSSMEQQRRWFFVRFANRAPVLSGRRCDWLGFVGGGSGGCFGVLLVERWPFGEVAKERERRERRWGSVDWW
ncbi:hypothetical protein FXO38_02291 [Capsicum annuum]|nr:hypothetical protein FXO37_30888 [Capsicum annuum]KAF3680465.1 hypothetical protein FXO38_02291 [Capsicum annuum]